MFPNKEQVSLTVLGDHSRVRADLALPSDEDGYQYQYLNDKEWEYTESTLHYRDGEWYLHLGYRKEKSDEEATTQNGTVLCVDLGVNQIAVTSTARFVSAGKLNSTTLEESLRTLVATSKNVERNQLIEHSTRYRSVVEKMST
ncbi:MAG: putative transposase [Haloquadratum walsbyi J07HQW2]|uniref:Putative transposase n=1 Tax=Haloquadratum walsbyi J07HQW2 TaxID=1238425 RepID=U1NHA5_9EURY|nr:MAG: putative transposase [Haloquadratum walsbyi J07HQW2]